LDGSVIILLLYTKCEQNSTTNARGAHESRDSRFLIPENLVPECMTHEQSFWYEILVPVLGRRTWVVCHGP